jgi:hypothetical protein
MNSLDLDKLFDMMIGEADSDIFELYAKNGRREFIRHVKFLRADCLNDAEDLVSDIIPDYWKTMSIRPVEIEYVWKIYEDLHVAYMTCKSILGLSAV